MLVESENNMTAVIIDHVLSWMIAVPFIGIAVLALLRDRESVLRIALAVTLVNLGLAGALWSGFDFQNEGMQFVERHAWMPTFGIQYAVGVDGISILLVLLTALLSPLCVLGSWKTITTRVKAFMMLILLATGMDQITAFSSIGWPFATRSYPKGDMSNVRYSP